MDLLETIQDVAEQTLPVPGNPNATGADGSKVNQKLTVSGWIDLVSPFKEKAYFWHQVWLSCGRPLNTEVHNIMKRTRNIYHYEYKKCQRDENKIKSSKLLDS